MQQREGNDIRYVAPEVVYAYDKAGRQVGERDARGNWTTRVVDALGRKTQEFDPVDPGSTTGQTSRLYAYDGFGRLKVEHDEKRRRTDYAYDGDGRMTRVDRPTLSSGTRPSETYDYDSLGQRIRHADMAGRIERTDYDALRRVSSVQTAGGYRKDYTYTWDRKIIGVGGVETGGWTRTTVDNDSANNLVSNKAQDTVEKLDVFGRVTWRQDLGGHTFDYRYNHAGLIKTQIGSTGQNIAHTYFANGYLASTVDTGAGTVSIFDYDPNGNRVYEHYRSTVGAGVIYQASTAKYDNLNRLISVSDPGRYEIKYAYDANGNRTWLRSEYPDGLGGTKSVQEYFYKYDALNRFRVTMGQLVGNTVVAGSGGDGVAIEYDEVGQRKTATYASDGHVEAYTYDALNRLETTTIDGRLRSSRSYDLGGRATGYVQYTDTGGARSSLTRVFDDNNRLKKETDTVTGRGTDYVYGLEGTLASTKTFSRDSNDTQQTSTYTYEWWDDAKRKSTTVEASNKQYVAWNPGFTKFWYDANGNVKGALDEVGGRSFEYMTTANGQVLRRDEMLGGRYDAALGRVLDSKANRHHGFFHFDGKRIGNVGNDGIEREDYVQQMSRVRDAEMSPDAKYRQYTPVAGADFDENYLPINASYPDIAPGRYTVRSVARTRWSRRSKLGCPSRDDTGVDYWILQRLPGLHMAQGKKASRLSPSTAEKCLTLAMTKVARNAKTVAPMSALARSETRVMGMTPGV